MAEGETVVLLFLEDKQAKPSLCCLSRTQSSRCWPPSLQHRRRNKRVEREVTIVPPVNRGRSEGLQCSFLLLGTWDGTVNTMHWTGASLYNARMWPSLPLTFVSLSKRPLSQQANICDQQSYRDYSYQQSSVSHANTAEENSKGFITLVVVIP